MKQKNKNYNVPKGDQPFTGAENEYAEVIAAEIKKHIGCGVRVTGNSIAFKRRQLSCNIFVTDCHAHYVLCKDYGLSPVLFDVNLADPTSIEQLLDKVGQHPADLAYSILPLKNYWLYVIEPMVVSLPPNVDGPIANGGAKLGQIRHAIKLCTPEELRQITSWVPHSQRTKNKKGVGRLLRRLYNVRDEIS